MFCFHCGKELPDDAAYCMRCGKLQHGEVAHHEIVQFLSFAVANRQFHLRSNDEQIAHYAFDLLKTVVKYPKFLYIKFVDDAWNIDYDGRKKLFEDEEFSVIHKAGLIHEYALLNGWIAAPLRTNNNERGDWLSTAYSYTRKVEI